MALLGQQLRQCSAWLSQSCQLTLKASLVPMPEDQLPGRLMQCQPPIRPFQCQESTMRRYA